MKVRVQMWGNCLAVRVPKAIADAAQLTLGDLLEIEVDERGAIHLRRTAVVPSLAQLVAQIKPENSYAELDWGAEIAKEAVEWQFAPLCG